MRPSRFAVCRTATALLVAAAAAAQGASELAKVDAHVGSATRFMQQRLYAEASAEYEKALALDPNNDPLRLQYATSLFAQERNDESRQQFEIVRRRLGNRDGLTYFLGLLDVRSEDYASAIRRLGPLEANKAFPKASYYLGLAYLSDGRTKEALPHLERAALENQNDPEVHYRLGRVYTLSGRQTEASREFQLYRQWHEHQRFAEQEGQSCLDALRTQTIAKAREVCATIVDPKDSRRLFLVGKLYADANAFADAVDPLQAAVKLDPNLFDAWQYLGMSLYALHRYQEAVPALETAVSLNPQFFDVLNLLAKTLHILGKDAAALPFLERAHNLNPADQTVAAALERMRASLKRTP